MHVACDSPILHLLIAMKEDLASVLLGNSSAATRYLSHGSKRSQPRSMSGESLTTCYPKSYDQQLDLSCMLAYSVRTSDEVNSHVYVANISFYRSSDYVHCLVRRHLSAHYIKFLIVILLDFIVIALIHKVVGSTDIVSTPDFWYFSSTKVDRVSNPFCYPAQPNIRNNINPMLILTCPTSP